MGYHGLETASSGDLPPHARRLAIVLLGMIVASLAATVGTGFASEWAPLPGSVAGLTILLAGGVPLVRSWKRLGRPRLPGGAGSSGPSGGPSGDRSPRDHGPAPLVGASARGLPVQESRIEAVARAKATGLQAEIRIPTRTGSLGPVVGGDPVGQ